MKIGIYFSKTLVSGAKTLVSFSETLVYFSETWPVSVLSFAGPAPSPVQGAVRLDIASALPPVLMALTLKIRDGLTNNVYYPDLTSTLAALTASYNGQRSLADQIASLEAQLKTARLAQGAESTNAREILKSAARACESVDSTDEALASVGWDLRKGRSPSWILCPPPPVSACAPLASRAR